MLDDEFAPRLANARDAVLAADPALRKQLDAYVEHSKVLAMHDTRPGLGLGGGCYRVWVGLLSGYVSLCILHVSGRIHVS